MLRNRCARRVNNIMQLSLIYHTIKHLKPIQIKYQVYYRLRKKWHQLTGFKYPLLIEKEGTPLNLKASIPRYTTFNNYTFTFLNQSKTFSKNNIDWNYPEYGKLWTYNLNYFDFLLQENMDKETGIELIENYIKNLKQNSVGLDPYPISLRGINWIKFISSIEEFTSRPLRDIAAPAARNEQDNSPRSPRESAAFAARKQINASLYAQYQILLDNLEYHLLGNHLLEDAFSLLFGAFYFNDHELYQTAESLLIKELKEQILNDGGHFELSTMYQQIMLDRLLDCINLLQNNQRFKRQDALLSFMERKAKLMLAWMANMTFSNNQIPLLNDAAPGIAPDTKQLMQYAGVLNLKPAAYVLKLSSSGYRRYKGKNYQAIIDVGQVGSSYQPGHAHADTFNFVLNVNNIPLIVDPGVSTYNSGKVRLQERGTASHNTVTVNDKDSSEVWSSFRVARRAQVKIFKDKKNHIIAQHDGYKKFGTTHQREWYFSENQIKINDTLTGKIVEGKAHLWLAPGLAPVLEANKIKINNVLISFQNPAHINLIPTKIPHGYNRFLDSYKIEIMFQHHLNTRITTN